MILYITKRFDNSFFKFNFFFNKRSLFDYFISKVQANKHIKIETKKIYIFESEEHSRLNLIGNEYREAIFSTFYFKEWHEGKDKVEDYTVLRNRMALISMLNNCGGNRKIKVFQEYYNLIKSKSNDISFILSQMNR